MNLRRVKGHCYSFLGILALCPDSVCLIYVSNAMSHHGTLLALRYAMNLSVSSLLYVYVCHQESLPLSLGFVVNGRRGLLAGFCFGIVHICVTFAFIVENAATVLVILASAPIWAALSSYLFLAEAPPFRTILCGLICFGCIIYMFLDKMLNKDVEENACVGYRDGVSGCRDCCDQEFSNLKQYNKCIDLCMNEGDVGKSGSILGLFASLIGAISFGVYFMLLRMLSQEDRNEVGENLINSEEVYDKNKGQYEHDEGKGKKKEEIQQDEEDEKYDIQREKKIKGLMQVLPCDILAALLATIVGTCMIRYEITMDFKVGLVLFVNSAVILPLSFTLLTLSPAYISAAEVSLYCLIETVIGPLFVWIAGYERPSTVDFIAGSILLMSLAINSFLSMKEEESSVDTLEMNKEDDEKNDRDGNDEDEEHMESQITSAKLEMY